MIRPLYCFQFSSQESPIRSFAPMLSCRTVDNHLQEGRMKVSVLPIRLNLDQDTLEFMEDFFETFIKLLHLKENQNTSQLKLVTQQQKKIRNAEVKLFFLV